MNSEVSKTIIEAQKKTHAQEAPKVSNEVLFIKDEVSKIITEVSSLKESQDEMT